MSTRVETTPACRRVAFLLVPNFSLISLAAASEPLRMVNTLGGRPAYRVELLSVDGAPVRSSSGMGMQVDRAMGEADDQDLVVVCGPNPLPEALPSALSAWLGRLARRGVMLGGVCTGSYVLARAGLLDGYRCTIHWEDMDRLRERFPRIIVSSRLFEIDRDRLTSSGGTAPMDMMFAFIARQSGDRQLAARVSELLVCERIRLGEDRQRIPLRQQLGTGQPKLSDAVALMEANLEEPLSVAEISRGLALSERQLERLFHDHLGVTPTRYYLRLRLERARRMLLMTTASVTEVAGACGFGTVAHFSRRYREFFSRPPSAERRRGPTHGGD